MFPVLEKRVCVRRSERAKEAVSLVAVAADAME